MNPKFMNVRDVMSELGVSKNKAYLVIRELNEELIAQGFMCVRGKVNRKYFEKKFYGFEYATDNTMCGIGISYKGGNWYCSMYVLEPK